MKFKKTPSDRIAKLQEQNKKLANQTSGLISSFKEVVSGLESVATSREKYHVELDATMAELQGQKSASQEALAEELKVLGNVRILLGQDPMPTV